MCYYFLYRELILQVAFRRYHHMNKARMTAVIVGAVALAVVVVPVAHAASLLSQVNQAMRDAGIVVTGVNQMGWGEGVVVGHYKTYQKLVDAMKWHRQQGRTIPDSSKFTKAVTSAGSGSVAMGATKCRNGNITSLSKSQVTITKPGGTVRLKLTSKQYTVAIGRSIVTGNQVKACSKDNFKSVAGNLTKLDEGNSSSGGGGGGSSDGGGGT